MIDSHRFEFQIPSQLSARIKAWRSRHPDLPNQSKATRMLIERGLEADAPAPTPDGGPSDKIVPVPKMRPLHDAPWNAATVNEDRTIACNTRINERIDAQLKWLLGETGRAKREVIEAALTQYLREELEKRGIKA